MNWGLPCRNYVTPCLRWQEPYGGWMRILLPTSRAGKKSRSLNHEPNPGRELFPSAPAPPFRDSDDTFLRALMLDIACDRKSGNLSTACCRVCLPFVRRLPALDAAPCNALQQLYHRQPARAGVAPG